MKEITLWIFLLPLIISTNCLKTRIFRGYTAPERSFKYHVLISAERSSRDYCGGSIIDKRWILTAAHCFSRENLRRVLIQVGSTMRSGRGGAFYRIERRVPHEAFNEVTLENDIALLRVDRDIEYNDKVQPIALANRDTIIGNNENVLFTGFGQLEDLTHSLSLKFVYLKMFGYDMCKAFEPQLFVTQICTVPMRGEGPSSGDSGGALVNQDGLQVGVYSGAFGEVEEVCGRAPELYTRVPSYRDWIDAKIRQN